MRLLQERANIIKARIDKVSNPDAKRILLQNYETLVAQPVSSAELLLRNLDGLEALLSGEIKITKRRGEPSLPDALEVEEDASIHMPPRSTREVLITPLEPTKSVSEKPEAGVVKQTTHLEYVARFFVEHPGEERLYAIKIIDDTGGDESTIRTALKTGNLPFSVKRSEPESRRVLVTLNTKAGKKQVYKKTPPQRHIFLENKLVELPGGFLVPAQTLAAWKTFPDIFDEGELYLYTTYDKVGALAEAIVKYRGVVELATPDLTGDFAPRYPLLRQVSKNERLAGLFDALLDNAELTRGQLEKIKMFKGDQTSLYHWEHGINERSAQTSKAIYFLTQDVKIDNDNKHLINPIVQLLRKRGMTFAELVYALDKPLVRVKHALDLMTISGTAIDSQACPYTQIPSIHTQCQSVPKIVGTLTPPEWADFMPKGLRAIYLECLRYGASGEFKTVMKKNVIGKKSPALEAVLINVAGQQYSLRPAGIFSGDKTVTQEEFFGLLKEAYVKNFSKA